MAPSIAYPCNGFPLEEPVVCCVHTSEKTIPIAKPAKKATVLAPYLSNQTPAFPMIGALAIVPIK